MIDESLFQYLGDNITFSQLWSTSEQFIKAYKEIGFPQTYTLEDGSIHDYVTDDNLQLIWLLMIGRFADSTIKPYNTYGAFQVRFMSRIWQHAPAWLKDLDIQNNLRALSLEDGSQLFEGSKAIYNHAFNPGTAPSTQDTNELNFVNEQNVTKYKKSKIEGLALLTDLLKKDVTEAFLRRFDDLFKTIIYSGRTLEYVTTI